ncbi:MAG: hypothetical protein KKB70_04135 [Proteobacteria bacterium]|nr:hypothetical protein [Pseudomonadota bacterium]MBU1610450.1 hypothetical protein [Pseudomonadota bacterium]
MSTSVTPESSSQTPKDEAKNEQELKLYSDFVRFSDSWMQRLNSSNSEGRSKMVVVQENGKYKARYHLLEKKSSVVRESPTRPGQYTGILRYHDVVYEAEGDTETATKNGPFSPVAGSAHAVSEIFQFMNGGWR